LLCYCAAVPAALSLLPALHLSACFWPFWGICWIPGYVSRARACRPAQTSRPPLPVGRLPAARREEGEAGSSRLIRNGSPSPVGLGPTASTRRRGARWAPSSAAPIRSALLRTPPAGAEQPRALESGSPTTAAARCWASPSSAEQSSWTPLPRVRASATELLETHNRWPVKHCSIIPRTNAIPFCSVPVSALNSPEPPQMALYCVEVDSTSMQILLSSSHQQF
jgi:hypothetical protein